MAEEIIETSTDTALESSETTTPETEKTFTQAQVDAIVGDRLARERAKYSDYDELKAQASKYTELEQSSQSELQAALERADASAARVAELEKQIADKEAAEAHQKLVNKIAKKYRVPADLRRFMSGTTVEELTEEAELLGASFAAVSQNEGKRPVDVAGAKDEMDQFFEALSAIFISPSYIRN